MALAVSVRFDFRDNKGKNSFTKIYVPNGFSIANYIEFAQGFAQLLAQLSAARLTRCSLCFGLDLSGATLAPDAGVQADVAEKAFFQFASSEPGFFSRMKIPTISDVLVVDGSDQIDTGDPAVAAFITAMENGLVTVGGTIQPCTDREYDLVSTDFARELFRKK